MYGEYARPLQVIPAYIRNVLHDEPISMMGTGDETSRDFIYVMDTVSAIKSALYADNAVDDEIINVGTGRETFLLNLANVIQETCSRPSEPFEPKTFRPRPGYKPIIHKEHRKGEQGARIVLDIYKAQKLLKMNYRGKEVPWEPQVDLVYGLRNTIWWMATTVGYNPKELEDVERKIYPEKFQGRTQENPQGYRV
jgi:nucleoside-diphosphate-sugar epimerase